jgi:hypothetical protein
MSRISRSHLCPNDFSNYIVGGNMCNAFAIGNLGAPNDFWMVGAPALEADAYPLITGNFFDSEGKHLFRLVKNVLTVNPRNCAKILGNHIGFEIHDGQSMPVLRVETTEDPGSNPPMLVTNITGTFFDAQKQRVGWADNAGLQFSGPTLIGFTGQTWAMKLGMTDDQMHIANWIALTHGAVHEVVTGHIKSLPEPLWMDGKLFKDATIEDCDMVVVTGEFGAIGRLSISGCRFQFGGAADRVRQLLAIIGPQAGNP